MNESKVAFLEARVEQLLERDREREAESIVQHNILMKLIQSLALRRLIEISPLIGSLEQLQEETVSPSVPKECKDWINKLEQLEELLGTFM